MGERTGEFPSPLSFQKGMAMKRMICLLLSACMLLCLAACGENTEQPPETESIDTTENQDGDHSHEIRLLTPEKTLHTYYEWEDETTFVKGKVCIFTIS